MMNRQNSQNHIPGDTYGAYGGTSPRDHQALTDLSRELMRIRYERQRIAGVAVRRGIEPNYDSSNQDIVDLFEQLCHNAGLNQRDHIPPLLLDQAGPGIVPHNFLHDTFANQDAIHNRNYRPGTYAIPRRPIRSPTAEPSRVFTVPNTPTQQPASPYPVSSNASTPITRTTTAASSLWGSMNTPSTMITTPIPPVPEAPELKPQIPASSPSWLGEPAMPLHRATFAPKGSKKRVKLDTWRFVSLPGGRLLEWKGENPAHSLRHLFSTQAHDTYPYTKHSALGEEPRRVTFQVGHRITLKDNDKPVMNNKYDVEYRFTQDDYLRDFQSDLRDKELLGTFEAAKIKCKNANHINEHIKVWRSRDSDQTPSLSFFANGSDEGFAEYAIKWFKSPVVQNAAKLEVTLELLKPPPGTSGDGKLKGMFRRKSTTRQGSIDSSTSHAPDSPLSPSFSKRGSTTTMGSSVSSNGEEYPPYCLLETYEKVRQLLITFTTEQDFRKFLTAYKESQNPSSVPRSNSVASASTGHSRQSSSAGTIAELSDPSMAGSPASTSEDIYRMPRLTAQGTPTAELPITPANRLFGRRGTGPVQHPSGFQQIYSDQPRLSPPSPMHMGPLTQRMQAANPVGQSSRYTELGIHLGRGVPGAHAPRAGSIELPSERDSHELHEETRLHRPERNGLPRSSSNAEIFEMDTPDLSSGHDPMEDTVVLDATGGLAGPEPLSIGAPRRGTGLLQNNSYQATRTQNNSQQYRAYRPP